MDNDLISRSALLEFAYNHVNGTVDATILRISLPRTLNLIGIASGYGTTTD